MSRSASSQTRPFRTIQPQPCWSRTAEWHVLKCLATCDDAATEAVAVVRLVPSAAAARSEKRSVGWRDRPNKQGTPPLPSRHVGGDQVRIWLSVALAR